MSSQTDRILIIPNKKLQPMMHKSANFVVYFVINNYIVDVDSDYKVVNLPSLQKKPKFTFFNSLSMSPEREQMVNDHLMRPDGIYNSMKFKPFENINININIGQLNIINNTNYNEIIYRMPKSFRKKYRFADFKNFARRIEFLYKLNLVRRVIEVNKNYAKLKKQSNFLKAKNVLHDKVYCYNMSKNHKFLVYYYNGKYFPNIKF